MLTITLLLIQTAIADWLLVSQTPPDRHGAQTVTAAVTVDASPEAAWSVIARFAQVGDFHPGVDRSDCLNGQQEGTGAERVCYFSKGRVMKDRITNWQQGKEYTYETFAWENLPLSRAIHTLGVRRNAQGQTELYQRTTYEMDSGWKTFFAKGKVRKQLKSNLLGYKYYIETGQVAQSMDDIERHYRS